MVLIRLLQIKQDINFLINFHNQWRKSENFFVAQLYSPLDKVCSVVFLVVLLIKSRLCIVRVILANGIFKNMNGAELKDMHQEISWFNKIGKF